MKVYIVVEWEYGDTGIDPYPVETIMKVFDTIDKAIVYAREKSSKVHPSDIRKYQVKVFEVE